MYCCCSDANGCSYMPQVPHAKSGDKIRVIDSAENVKRLQVDHGGWVDSMKEVSINTDFLLSV